MTVISQLKASSSRHAKIPTSLKISAWVNKFANPLPGQPHVVVEGAHGTFTMENGVTKVSTSLYSNLYMESRDEPLVCPANFPVSDETKSELHEGVMFLFPQPTLVDKIGSDEDETMVTVRWSRSRLRLRKDGTLSK
ncbi:hypothetical protein C1H46_018991 [Malus baccata]|uniref:Uncharacterized protein n=1 Tax=Malus baccata TaxID=106549 RepID=A0A540M9L5_MALBA|nr:hypothetical protein C1H46_018991 [Malus baccata]